jgi:hypothetical protein
MKSPVRSDRHSTSQHVYISMHTTTTRIIHSHLLEPQFPVPSAWWSDILHHLVLIFTDDGPGVPLARHFLLSYPNDTDAARRELFTAGKEDFRVPTSSRCAVGCTNRFARAGAPVRHMSTSLFSVSALCTKPPLLPSLSLFHSFSSFSPPFRQQGPA